MKLYQVTAIFEFYYVAENEQDACCNMGDAVEEYISNYPSPVLTSVHLVNPAEPTMPDWPAQGLVYASRDDIEVTLEEALKFNTKTKKGE